MRILFVPLALLLLALCRSSFAKLDYSIVSTNTESSSSKSSFSFVAPEKRAKAQESVKQAIKEQEKGQTLSADQEKELMKAMGNVILLGALGGFDLNRVPYLQAAFRNGVICDADEPSAKDKIKELIYGGTYSDEMKTKERTEAEAKSPESQFICTNPNVNKPGADDTRAKAWKAFCEDDPPATYIYAVLRGTADALAKKFGKKKCLKQALEDLKTASPALGKVYDMDGFEKREFTAEFSGKDIGAVTKNEDQEMAKVFCDATLPAVETAVKDLYAADGLYWIAESILSAVVFGAPSKPVSEVCQEAKYKSKYGECVCKLETGFSFCIYKVLGEYFKENGYLECTAEKKFEAAKKPKALPQLIEPSKSSAATTATGFFSLALATVALLARQ